MAGKWWLWFVLQLLCLSVWCSELLANEALVEFTVCISQSKRPWQARAPTFAWGNEKCSTDLSDPGGRSLQISWSHNIPKSWLSLQERVCLCEREREREREENTSSTELICSHKIGVHVPWGFAEVFWIRVGHEGENSSAQSRRFYII